MTGSLERSLMLLCWVGALTGTPAAAQITPDSSLSTTVTQSGSQSGSIFTIDQGDRAGPNLFHSFSQFSVPTGGAAIFNNATDVQNIFSRVTGGNISQIDGVIRANGTANLFLLNPNGILFGPKAALNIGGSFVGTTANSIRFADGVEFKATNPSASPLLTVSAPIGLQMGQNPGAIQAIGPGHQLTVVAAGLLPIRNQTPRGLQVLAGKTLALIGGEINLTGGILSAPGGHIEMGSVRVGLVSLTATNQGWAFNYAANTQFQDIRLTQRALVDASGSGGSMQLRGQNLFVADSSTLLIQHTGSQRGGDLILNASAAIEFWQSQPSPLSARIETQTLGTGATGEVQITAQRLSLQKGAMINTASYGAGGSGTIRINVAESIAVFGAFSGDLSTDVSRIAASGFRGNTGDILIATPQLSLRDGGSIFSVTVGQGSSGNLTLNVGDFIEIGGVKPNVVTSTLSTSTYNSGQGGNLTINTPKLTLREGGRISSSTYANGQAGNLVINASESVDVSGIATDTLQSPSLIVASALSASPVLQRVLGISAIPTGNAGNVIINAPALSIHNGAQVGVNNIGPGDAGNLTIGVDRLFLSNQGQLTASTASGEGGNIVINVRDWILLRRVSDITATANGSGNGGNILINAPMIAGFENSDIIANAVQGRGGNIQITTQGIFGLKFRPQLTSDNDITASSQFGVNGTVLVNTIAVDPSSGLVELPINLVDSTQQIAAGCAGVGDSQFVITGRGGIPEDPTQAIRDDRPWADVRDPIAFRSSISPRPISPSPRPLTEASTWQRTPDGTIELIALNNRTANASAPATCASAVFP